MALIRLFVRLILVSLLILNFAIWSFLTILIVWSPFAKRSILSFLVSKTSSAILAVIGFEISQSGSLPKKGSLIIGNHLSYLDILIYASHFRTLFVTSTDMRSRFFLGQLTQLGGCLYVNRRNPKNLINELKNIKRFFDRGFTVTIFPEGTSSDGSGVLPFKKSLFQIALQTGCPIQPVNLCYTHVDGERFSPKNCDRVCWYGDLPFFPHLIGLLKMKSVKANMEVLESIDSKGFTDRKEICDLTYERVSKAYMQSLKS